MSTESKVSAAELAQERLSKAAAVNELRNDLMATEDVEQRFAKAEELQKAVTDLESIDRECQMAAALENAEAMVKKLSQQPNRPSPVQTSSLSTGAFVKANRGNLAVTESYGLGHEDLDADEVRGTADYQRGFRAFVKARGNVERIKDHATRDIIEKYGIDRVGDDGGAEVYIPFRKEMTLGSTTNGSFAAPYDLRPDIITQRTITPIMSRLVQNISTVTSPVRYPRNLDSSNTPQVGTGYSATKGEIPNTTTSEKNTGPLDQLTIDINTGTAWTDVSLDLLEDVPFMESYLIREGTKAFAAAYDNETINGVTASSQCLGVISCTSVGITKTGTNATLTAPKVVEAFYSFRSQYSTRLAWVMARPTMGRLVNLLDANNRPLFLPSFEAGVTMGQNGMILSTPVYFNDYVPASTGTGTPKSIVVGDWEEYILATRSGISVSIDTTSLRYANKARITWRYRFGGAPRDYRAFQIVHESA
jgi:HK97 family phage major capsid protein